ncbi:DUF4625 domain-containing protein [Carboxylicivirga sp. M1479]|uniref:DUF4625 domain-containing protein n=1 Tax=Carboxylicivirga sp. M1479 TaxID=2594476 RepID=UPI0011776A99|nr:DUF4625 domain-containing protein [Carboxylicivirga sp. M1479]TRX66534.1 DUF4625 domain-containing protein [Carboxylicivirga sp. M1479]
MKQFKYIISALALLLMVATACEKEKDTISPIVDMETPAIGQKYYRGEIIKLNAHFSDEGGSGLKECALQIHSVLKGWDDAWIPDEEIVQLSGSSMTVKDHIVFNGEIPYDIMSGAYVISVRVSDRDGNLTQFSRNIEIE